MHTADHRALTTQTVSGWWHLHKRAKRSSHGRRIPIRRLRRGHRAKSSTPSRVAVGVNPSIASGPGRLLGGCLGADGLLGEDIDILAAQSRDGGMSWDEPEPLNADANEDSNEDLGVQLASDGAGSWRSGIRGINPRAAGDDEDVFVLPFALASDCDGDGIGDAQQSRLLAIVTVMVF
ncbi:MAG: hypothetical protein R3E58_01495 [Phycisphaerae bacterium]